MLKILCNKNVAIIKKYKILSIFCIIYDKNKIQRNRYIANIFKRF